ncbi:probable inactive ATP-dependent zinc metalloprotease FTSHI 2, chloroplastic isoform X2 [Brassica napus]|uniref:uncharacterized protein LOC106319871 isoform X2 n=1 Tax=Brassica oleracea var. oleracea TaxID=109376 RepID=UPI0006A74881|nr:PREDICTED: uncharacterized protein LOC106319871 isoform X2 [Brassica oleracea var. oleracea]XP_013667119.1 probable inactive ATP-dependent zinc metalloprotease FTSHI 2, chloroplastic isoform X2 [Brassica napus]
MVWCDQLSTIWAETSDNARSAARSLVLGGLSEKHHGLNNFWDIDVEALRILNMYYDRAKEVTQMKQHRMKKLSELRGLKEKLSLK